MGASASASSVFETRSHQMFPTLAPAEVDRLRRFGDTRTYQSGEQLIATGDLSPGMFVILNGEVTITQHSALGYEEEIVTYGPGSFVGELNQLSGRPSLVDARAVHLVDALVIPSPRLRDVLVAEAELGERIMRALILRRVGLLQGGIAGPLIVGRAGDSGVLRLAGFLSRNGQPHQTLDPDRDACAKTLIERFSVEPAQLPIVLCANGQLPRNPSEVELARCLGLVRPIDPNVVYDVAIIGAGPAGLAAAVYAASEGLSVIVLECRAFGGQAGASARIEKAGEEVALVGGGNSAGQAAVYLAGQVAKLWLLVRGQSLEASMSRYLVDRIAGLSNVEVLLESEVTALEGDGGVLEAVRWRDASGRETRRPIRQLFLFIGADPNTKWLSPSDVALDDNGFVRAGAELGDGHRPLETSRPGVFAIGDVRAGSVKRVAAAVGEGAQVIAALHTFLAAIGGEAGPTRNLERTHV